MNANALAAQRLGEGVVFGRPVHDDLPELADF